jgi:hypothetical protein
MVIRHLARKDGAMMPSVGLSCVDPTPNARNVVSQFLPILRAAAVRQMDQISPSLSDAPLVFSVLQLYRIGVRACNALDWHLLMGECVPRALELSLVVVLRLARFRG